MAEVRAEYITDHELEANANLIAAAPDLLGACQMALAQIQQDNDERHVPDNLRGTEAQVKAVIAKAKGGA